MKGRNMTEENENLGAGVGFIDGEYLPVSDIRIRFPIWVT